jgi:hypothetical protein
MRSARAVPLCAALCAFASTAGAEGPSRGSTVAVFSIAKSENKNQVQYVIRLDDDCVPVGEAPVSAYWRMLEEGPTQTAPILPREVRAYGLASQNVVARGPGGGTVRIALNALPGRPMTIATSHARDGCRALALMPISGVPAHLFNVYVHLKWDGVDYLLLRGWSADGSHVATEKISE